jgi:hypothetical protein
MEIAGHLRHVGLPQGVEAVQKVITLPIVFIERPSSHANAVAKSTLDLSQSDLGFGTVRGIVGDPGSPPTRPVVRPTLWKKQIAVQQ